MKILILNENEIIYLSRVLQNEELNLNYYDDYNERLDLFRRVSRKIYKKAHEIFRKREFVSMKRIKKKY